MKLKFYFFLVLLAIVNLSNFKAQIPNYVPSNGLVAWWPFSGNANDISGNGNNGTVNGAILTNDRFGNTNSAYYFSSSGCSTRIDAQVNTTSIRNGLTISIWVLRKGDGCNSPRILEFWPNNNPDGPGMAQWEWNNGSNVLRVGSITSSGLSCLVDVPVGGDNVWYNIVYTNDGTIGKFYNNGTLISSLASDGNPILSGNVAFGRMNHSGYDNLNGALDDIGIWNRALTSSEVQQLYSGQLSTNEVSKNMLVKYQPNPVENILVVSSDENILKATVYNMAGQLVLAQKFNSKEILLDVSKLTAGNYVVKIEGKEQSKEIKIIKK